MVFKIVQLKNESGEVFFEIEIAPGVSLRFVYRGDLERFVKHFEKGHRILGIMWADI